MSTPTPLSLITMVVFLGSAGVAFVFLIAWLVQMIRDKSPRKVRRICLWAVLIAVLSALINALS